VRAASRLGDGASIENGKNWSRQTLEAGKGNETDRRKKGKIEFHHLKFYNLTTGCRGATVEYSITVTHARRSDVLDILVYL